jgi:methionyl-tRNA formyltransferase
LKILFLSRPLNRIGFALLHHLARDGEFMPSSVLVHDSAEVSEDPSRLDLAIRSYADEVARYGCEPIKHFNSLSALAESHGIASQRIGDIRSADVRRRIESLAPDLVLIGGGWPQRIPPEILRIPPLGALNIHPSLLPDFRGTDVHRWQILAGVDHSGISVHYVDREFDTGDLLAQTSIALEGAETPQRLVHQLAEVAGPLVASVLGRIQASGGTRLAGRAQSSAPRHPYCPRWPWADVSFLRIRWSSPARELERLVRASTQESYKYNGPHFRFESRQYLIRQCTAATCAGPTEPGTVLECSPSGIVVACGADALELRILQPCSIEDWDGGGHLRAALSPQGFASDSGIAIGSRLD